MPILKTLDAEGLAQIKCPSCGNVASYMDYDIAGSCPGCVFCTSCHTEIDSDTGEVHPFGDCCERTMPGITPPVETVKQGNLF